MREWGNEDQMKEKKGPLFFCAWSLHTLFSPPGPLPVLFMTASYSKTPPKCWAFVLPPLSGPLMSRVCKLSQGGRDLSILLAALFRHNPQLRRCAHEYLMRYVK
jgi:hypothetical protein